MQRVLVTGATGKIGSLLVEELLKQQFRVRLLLRARSTSAVARFHPNIEIFYGDIIDYPSVLAAVSDVDCVFHLAALLHINNPPPHLHGRYHQINVIGTQNIIEASSVADVERVVLFSTISVYGTGSPGQIFSETSPVNPTTIYSETKLLAEEKALEHKGKHLHRPDITILRLAAVYGKHVTGNYMRLVKAVSSGFFPIPVSRGGISCSNYGCCDQLATTSSINHGPSIYRAFNHGLLSRAADSGCAVRTLIHENDVVSGAILAATHPEAIDKIYNLTDGEVHSLEEVIQAVADALSVNVRILKIPEIPLKKVSNFIHKYCHKVTHCCGEHIEKAAFIIDKLMENIAVDGLKIQRELGFKPQYDLKNGWRYSLQPTDKR